MKSTAKEGKSGFTLVELIIVIIILGILAALAIPQFKASTEGAKRSAMLSSLAEVQQAIRRYQLDHDGRLYQPARTLQLR